MVKLVTSLLASKPNDPVPHIYSYLLEYSKGTPPDLINPITNNELNELVNLKKKIEYCKEALNFNEGHDTPSEESDDEVEEIQPKKKNIKA
jgi:hypothetical protein